MAMGNRKAAEAVILKWISELDPSGLNTEQTKTFFKDMSDVQFDEYINRLEQGLDFVSLVYENLKDSQISVDNNLRVAQLMKHEFFEKLWLTDAITGRTYLTPLEYLVIDLPVKRQVEMLTKKISIPDDNRHIDELTDQPTGVSKGASLSYPEMLVLYSKGLDQSIIEMMKFRGGDSKAFLEMERSIRDTGGVDLKAIDKGNTKVKSTMVLSTLLKGMHLDNNF